MAMYVSLIQFTDQGIRNVKDTINDPRLRSPRPRKWA
jgi:uncharacterized protein with GYD domain